MVFKNFVKYLPTSTTDQIALLLFFLPFLNFFSNLFKKNREASGENAEKLLFLIKSIQFSEAVHYIIDKTWPKKFMVMMDALQPQKKESNYTETKSITFSTISKIQNAPCCNTKRQTSVENKNFSGNKRPHMFGRSGED